MHLPGKLGHSASPPLAIRVSFRPSCRAACAVGRPGKPEVCDSITFIMPFGLGHSQVAGVLGRRQAEILSQPAPLV